jgi:hypothetical protein
MPGRPGTGRDDCEEIAMTSSGSQSLPTAAGMAADAISSDEDPDEATRDSEDGVPVGRADAEADKRRAEAETERD